jgi:hypothetical protein
MKTFDYIQDPGHGWVKVPVYLLAQLGIYNEISSFSYYLNGFAYLEEDCDTAVFFKAYRSAFGVDPKLKDKLCRVRQSKVRSYYQYSPALVKNVFFPAERPAC